MIWGIWGQFPQIALKPKYLQNNETQPLETLNTRVKANLMWNVELKTLDYFSCVSVQDLGYSSQVSPNCPNTWVPVRQV